MAPQQFPLWAWVAVGAAVLALLVIDLFMHRGERGQSRSSAMLWSGIWLCAGLAGGACAWWIFGARTAQEYLAAYLIELSLSLDNLFVFLMVFQSLNIPHQQQHRVLFWGIFGAVVFRGLFIFLGVAALAHWAWIGYGFGALLLYGAYRAFRENLAEPRDNQVVAWLSRFLPITQALHDKHFVARENGRRVATPLLIALLAIEVTDIVFASDSVPAALSVSRNFFVVYCSNIFAILALRALYGVLAHTIGELEYLHYGLAGVLAFAGIELILGDLVQVPPLVSVGVIAVLLGATTWASMRARSRNAAHSSETTQAS